MNIINERVENLTFKKSQANLRNSHEILQVNNSIAPDNHEHIGEFRPAPVDSHDIVLVITHLHSTNSCDSDGIPLRFLRDSLFAIIPYLTCIRNTSIVTRRFRESWKYSVVVPILKSGDVNTASNYRPISLLSIISTILEKIVATLNMVLDQLYLQKLHC